MVCQRIEEFCLSHLLERMWGGGELFGRSLISQLKTKKNLGGVVGELRKKTKLQPSSVEVELWLSLAIAYQTEINLSLCKIYRF